MTIKLLIRNKKVLDVAIVIHSFSLSPARTSNDFDSDDEAKGRGRIVADVIANRFFPVSL
jgi:hypothetical protein